MNLSFFVLLFVILLQTWSGDTLGSKEQVQSETSDLNDPSKTICREHIEQALNKYWDQEKNAAKATVSSSSSTLDKKTDKSSEKEQVKTSTIDSSSKTSKDKAKPPCEDDDNDGICNEDEVDEPVAKTSADQSKSSKTTTPSPAQKATPSCPDDDNDGICNDDEIEETTKPPSTKGKQTSKQDTSKVDKSKSIPSKDSKATPAATKKSNVKSVPEKEQKVKKIVEDLDEDDDDDDNDDDEDEDEEEEVVTVAVKKSQGGKDKTTKGGTSGAKSSSEKDKKVPEKSGVKDKKKKPEKALVEDEDDEDEDEDDDEDDEPIKKKQAAAAKKNTKQSQQKEKEKDDKKKSKSKKTNKRDNDEDDDQDEDEDVKSSSKKTDAKSKKTSKPSSKTESKEKSPPEVSKSTGTTSTTLQQESNQTELSGKSHVDEILKLRKIGSKEDKSEQNLITSLLKDLKKIYENSIKPLEQLYKYRGISSRLLSDAEIFSKPLVLLLGPKGGGKTSIVNYLLGLQNTPWQLNTGLSTSYPHFTLILHGDTFTKLSPTEVAADFTFSGLQKFGQHFMEHHIQAFKMPLDILQKMTFVDCPGFMDGMSGIIAKEPGKAIDTEVYQWLIDRSDVIYIVIDVNQLHLTSNLQSLYEQLRGREIRFLLTKADTVSHSEIVTVIGKLLWMLSPLMTGDTPPKVYALTTQMESYEPFLDEQEQEWLNDLSRQVSGLARVESHIAEVRRHAVRVRNHAKLVDCYLATYYIHKPLFIWGASSRKFASEITENPDKYRVFSGALTTSLAQNVSRYDLPDPEIYKEFFRTTSLVDFKPLSATCSFFRGCPIDKLDVAIAYQLPDLVSKYKKLTKNKQQ